MTDNAPIPLVMTRPRAQGEAFVDALDGALRQRLWPIYTPLIEIVPLGSDITVAPEDNVIFTSANGVACANTGAGQTAYCVGAATTAAAQAAGWSAVHGGNTSDELVSHVAQLGDTARLWHLAGVHTRGQVSERLQASGRDIRYVPVYDQELRTLTTEALDAFRSEKRLIVPLFSPRTAKQFAKTAPKAMSAHIIALSPAIAHELGNGIVAASVEILHHPNAMAMQVAIENIVRSGDMG